MTSNLRLVVTKKIRQKAGDTGVLQILCSIDELDNVIPTDPNQFPSGLIWISKGYDNNIEHEFSGDEPFLLDFFEKSDREKDEISSNSNTAEHWSLGKHAKKLDSEKLLPVIKSELPDKSTGLLKYTRHSVPSKQFYIENDSFLYGPYTATPTDEEVYVTPSQCLPLALNTNFVAKIPLEAISKANTYISLQDKTDFPFEAFISSNKDLSNYSRKKYRAS
ncbi:hypothetical protein RS130_22170 [Paraglaciecola aquimarina]|uniref:Uncharacterized protein n=1 Tax=Paraglaciecola aquimarina TaxID=1235557 RepID=A0ABU3T1S7_9ALTE|nr:hypothetical protein [Paraglaciecola aquimarina]MDU0356229.1 hypothetical protein [Paraglaciecola aquimarina]